jgi:hypothetical protein
MVINFKGVAAMTDAPTTNLKSRIAISIVLAGVLAVLIMIFPAVAPASGITAGYAAGTGYCSIPGMAGTGNRIVATAPQIDPAQIAPNGVGGSQLVGFRVNLERWNQTSQQWVAISRSPIKVHWQGYGFYSDVWYDPTTGTQVNGLSQFRIGTSGYYRVAYDLVWYADNGAATGHVSTLPESLQDYRLDPPAIVDWCQY